MNLYPKLYLNNVKEITIELLKQNNIKGLILDVDNTLINLEKQLLEGCQEWCNNLKKHGIKMCILSNTNKVHKVKKVAETLVFEDFSNSELGHSMPEIQSDHLFDGNRTSLFGAEDRKSVV